MCEFGIGKTVIICADDAMQIGRSATGISYDKDRLFDLDLFVFEEKDFIDQAEQYMYQLIEKIKEYEKNRK